MPWFPCHLSRTRVRNRRVVVTCKRWLHATVYCLKREFSRGSKLCIFMCGECPAIVLCVFWESGDEIFVELGIGSIEGRKASKSATNTFPVCMLLLCICRMDEWLKLAWLGLLISACMLHIHASCSTPHQPSFKHFYSKKRRDLSDYLDDELRVLYYLLVFAIP